MYANDTCYQRVSPTTHLGQIPGSDTYELGYPLSREHPRFHDLAVLDATPDTGVS